MKKEEIIKEIIDWSETQDSPKELYSTWEQIYKILKTRASNLEREQKIIFSPGDNVIIKSRRGDIKAQVIRLLDKNVQVYAPKEKKKWRVAPSYLEHDLSSKELN